MRRLQAALLAARVAANNADHRALLRYLGAAAWAHPTHMTSRLATGNLRL
jgi:hypothetical protein